MITFVTFLWPGPRNYQPEHVDHLANAIRYFYPEPHRFVCVTREAPERFSKGVRVIPTPPASERMGSLRAPQGADFPSSYRRLWLFSDEAEKLIKGHVMLLDVDSMIVGDLRPLILPYLPHDFVGWRPNRCWGKENRIGGGTWLYRIGTRTHIWNEFKASPAKMIQFCKDRGWNGSDQAVMSEFLYHEQVWPKDSGIHGAQEGLFQWNYPPPGARIVHSNGSEKHFGEEKLWMAAYNRVFSTSPERTIEDWYNDHPEDRPA